MKEVPVRRLAWVLLLYGIATWLLLPLLDVLQRMLALPPVFAVLVRVGLVLGLVAVLALAWRYPDVGRPSEPPDGGSGGA